MYNARYSDLKKCLSKRWGGGAVMEIMPILIIVVLSHIISLIIHKYWHIVEQGSIGI